MKNALDLIWIHHPECNPVWYYFKSQGSTNNKCRLSHRQTSICVLGLTVNGTRSVPVYTIHHAYWRRYVMTDKSISRYESPCADFIYCPEVGDCWRNIPSATPLEDSPDNWCCPECGAEKYFFWRVEWLTVDYSPVHGAGWRLPSDVNFVKLQKDLIEFAIRGRAFIKLSWIVSHTLLPMLEVHKSHE